MGAVVPENIYLKEGKAGEIIITGHLSGKKADKRIEYLDLSFPIVEEKQFDDRLRFKKTITVDGIEYLIQGFADGLNPKVSTRLEVKLSSTPWSLGRFEKSYQRKMYIWLDNGKYKTDYLITGLRDPNTWATQKLQVSRIQTTPKDGQDAFEWVMKGIERLKNAKEIMASGDKSTGLVDGRCISPFCLYGVNCQFK